MKIEKSEKVTLLFSAVIDLIEEGMDIHTMKVIDITNRAGIGKGTAYEYFKSKEELVASAIVWDISMQFQQLLGRLESRITLKEQIYEVFDWMEENMKRRRSAVQFFKLLGHSYELTEGIHQECRKMAGENQGMLEQILGDLRDQGVREKLIAPGLPVKLVSMAEISMFITYFLYLKREDVRKELSGIDIRQFLYENLLSHAGTCHF